VGGRVPTAIRAYDPELGGGIPEGSITLLRGGPGTMKSSLAFSILLANGRQGRRGLYVTLDQEAAPLLQQMEAMGLAAAHANGGLTVLDLGRGREGLDRLLRGAAPGRRPSQVFAERLDDLRRQGRHALLAIDSWNALEIALDFRERRQETFEFFRWLRSTGLTALLVAEASPEDEDDFSEEFLADAIFYLRLESAGDRDYRRRIQCAKLRGTAHSHDFHTLLFENGQFEAAKAIG
jgi:circadian clock protein KaiC